MSVRGGMESESTPQSRGKLFELADQPQYDLAAPQQLIEREDRRITYTLMYSMTYKVGHPDADKPYEEPPDAELIEAIENQAFSIINREANNMYLQLNPSERLFLANFLGISRPRHASGQAIRVTYHRRMEYLATLHYANNFGLTIAEATQDRESGRAPLLYYHFEDPRILTELRRRVDAGNNPELTEGPDQP